MLYAKTEFKFTPDWLETTCICMLWLVKTVNVIYEPVTELFICFRQSKENLSQAVEVFLLYGCRQNSLDI